MRLREYKESLSAPLRQVTLLYLVRDTKVLLAMKKRGFGAGRWNGVGGKPNPGETIPDAAIREAYEEIGIKPVKMRQVATLNFYTPHKPEWNQQVIVFESKKWQGDPLESEEMAPQWFDQDKIPYDDMWPDDKYWFPLVLAGKTVVADFLFSEDGSLQEYFLSPDIMVA